MKEVFISDIHWPWTDMAAWSLTIRIVDAVNPDLIWIGGDYIDFYPISRWDRDPRRKLQLQGELDMAVRGLRDLRLFAPDARIVLQEGNHEDRLRRFLWSRAEELSGLNALKFENLLSLPELDVEFIQHGNPTKVGHLWHVHGDEVRSGNVNFSRGKLVKLFANVIFGHHHRFQVDYMRSMDGKVVGAWANGCLCGLKPEYDINPQWTHGLTLVDYAKSGTFSVTQVPFFARPGRTNEPAAVVHGELLA